MPGNPATAVEILCNKDQFRKFLTDNGFHAPQSGGYSDAEAALADLKRFCLPVIVKPVDSSGSKGATVLHDWKCVKQALEFAFAFSRSHRIIIEEYKKAAKKTHSSAKSNQNVTLKKISINNGEYDNAISMVKPLIAKFIESNSTQFDGITGGFENLVSKDVKSAKAYKSSDGTVIEMTMVEQTAGAKEDALSGSVGHAITTVGDISEVTGDLSAMGLPLELSEKDTKIYYTNPVVKVVIGADGKITSGTWSYTVEICMNNMKAFGKTVDKASITMENTITL